MPVPLKGITVLALLEDDTVNFPVSAPIAVGSNCRFRVAVCPAFKVIGKVTPDSENPVPAIVALLTVTAPPPDALKVRDCVAGTPKPTFPNATLEELMVSAGDCGFSLRRKDSVALLALDVRVTVAAVVTAAAVAVKVAVVAPKAIVTDAGTVTEGLLLAKFTVVVAVAAADKVIVQESVPAPVIELLEQANALRPDPDFEFATIPPQPVNGMQLPRATKPNRKNEDR
jgi:hypothetical protein